MACRMRLAHGRTTPTAAPGPLLVPLPFPPSVAVVTRGLAFPFEDRHSNAFPLPPKTKSGAAPQGSSAPFRKNRNQRLQAFGHQTAHLGAAHQGAAVFHDVAGTETVTQGLAHGILHGVGFF